MTTKFQNNRDAEDEEVKATFRKRKLEKKTCIAQPKSSAPPQWGLSNYLPDLPLSEDDETIQRHTQWLVQEKKKRYPDITRVGQSMKATLSTRRRNIVTGHASVGQVESDYPWLFEESQVSLTLKEYR